MPRSHGSRYLLREMIPANLRPYFEDGREFRIVLRSSDRRTARYATLSIRVLVQAELERLTKELVPTQTPIQSYNLKRR